jgi:hypothetical protein
MTDYRTYMGDQSIHKDMANKTSDNLRETYKNSKGLEISSGRSTLSYILNIIALSTALVAMGFFVIYY